MQIITITGMSNISYEILKDYHSTAQIIYVERLKQNQPLLVEFEYEIDLQAEDEADAKEIFLNYLHRLNHLQVANHSGHLVYITQHILEFEGNYIKEEAIKNDLVMGDLLKLLKLLKIKESDNYNSLNIEVKHKSQSNGDFQNYVIIENDDVIADLISSAVKAQFEHVMSNIEVYPYELREALNAVKLPSVTDITSLVAKAEQVNYKKFHSDLIYTICDTLHRFLNERTDLNPDKAFVTNDQLRVIYQTLKLHGLLKVDHEGFEPDEINFTRSILVNKRSGYNSMLATIYN